MTDPTPKPQGTFFRLTTEDLLFLTSMLTDTELKVYLYLKSLNPFTNNYKKIDTAQIAENLGINRRTVQRFIKKFQDLDLIDLEVTCFKYRTKELGFDVSAQSNAEAHSKSAQPNVSTKELEGDRTIAKRSYDRQSDPTIAETILRSPERSYDRIEEPEPLSDGGLGLSKINKNIKISQIAEGEEKIFSDPENSNKPINPEKAVEICTKIIKNLIETNEISKEEEDKKISKDGSVKGEFSAPPVSPNKNAIADSNDAGKHKEKLESLGIEWRRVKNAIARAHESQILGAIAHVEANWEEIKDPSAVFLYQLPKQKIEPLSGGRVFRAAEAGYSLNQVKQIYPNNWREAAPYFGFDVSFRPELKPKGAQPNGLSVEENEG